MTIQEMVFDFKQKGDKLDAQYYQNLRLAQIIRILNNAQMNVVMNKYIGDDTRNIGFPGNQKRIEELQILEVVDELVPVGKKSDKHTYAVPISNLQKQHMLTTGIFAYGTSGDCKEDRMKGYPTDSNRKAEDLEDNLINPSWLWREFLYQPTESILVVYAADDFEIVNLSWSYIRYPRNMDLSGYKHFNGTASMNTDCELPEFLQYEIVDQAVLNSKLYLSDNAGIQPANVAKSMNE